MLECSSKNSVQISTSEFHNNSSERPQAVWVGNNTSRSISLNTGAPQACVLGPLPFILLTHDCTTTHRTNRKVKCADETTLVDGKTHSREAVDLLTTWCWGNNPQHQQIQRYCCRLPERPRLTLTINGAAVERVRSTKVLRANISKDLYWITNTASLAKKLRGDISCTHHEHILPGHQREKPDHCVGWELHWLQQCTQLGRSLAPHWSPCKTYPRPPHLHSDRDCVTPACSASGLSPHFCLPQINLESEPETKGHWTPHFTFSWLFALLQNSIYCLTFCTIHHTAHNDCFAQYIHISLFALHNMHRKCLLLHCTYISCTYILFYFVYSNFLVVNSKCLICYIPLSFTSVLEMSWSFLSRKKHPPISSGWHLKLWVQPRLLFRSAYSLSLIILVSLISIRAVHVPWGRSQPHWVTFQLFDNPQCLS